MQSVCEKGEEHYKLQMTNIITGLIRREKVAKWVSDLEKYSKLQMTDFMTRSFSHPFLLLTIIKLSPHFQQVVDSWVYVSSSLSKKI